MSIIDKLPAAFSSLALVNSVTIPFLIKEDKPEVIKVPEKSKVVTVAKPAPRRKSKPSHITQRWTEIMNYLECIESGKTKEICRANNWFWE